MCFFAFIVEKTIAANRELHQQKAIVVWKELEPLGFCLNLADLVSYSLAQGSRGDAKMVTQIDANKLVRS